MEALSEANRYIEQTGKDVAHLSLGQPGSSVPEQVLEYVAKAAVNKPTGYTETAGVKELRKRIALHYKELYGQDVSHERVFVTVGSSGAFMLALLAAFDKGDEVAITLPCYPAYPNIMKAEDVKPVYLRGEAEHKFQPRVEMLQRLERTPKGMVICSPSNPTGTVLTRDAMHAMANYCDEMGIRLISDEIYHGITYGENVHTALEFSDHAIVINSFSKYFLMPGWRLGWAVVPEELVATFSVLAQNFFISPPTLAQYGALEVLECKDKLDAEVANYAANRELMLEMLPKAGFTKLTPAEGAFYIYADVSHLCDDSAVFCRRMLHEAGLVAVSGHDFDPEDGGKFIRFSYSASHGEVQKGLQRLVEWMEQLKAAA
jgi:aspartate/methionine/tyrosine aminotransferase